MSDAKRNAQVEGVKRGFHEWRSSDSRFLIQEEASGRCLFRDLPSPFDRTRRLTTQSALLLLSGMSRRDDLGLPLPAPARKC